MEIQKLAKVEAQGLKWSPAALKERRDVHVGAAGHVRQRVARRAVRLLREAVHVHEYLGAPQYRRSKLNRKNLPTCVWKIKKSK